MMSYEIIKENPYNGKALPEKAKGIVIKGDWGSEYKEVIEKNDLKALFLNSAKSWRCESYSFLEDLPNMLLIDIIDNNGNGITAVENQTDVRELNLNLPINNKVDFNKLKSLEDCYITWNKNLDSIFRVETLKKLYIDEFKTKESYDFSKLKNLKELTIGNSNILSLDFLYYIQKIERFELLNCRKITDFSPVSTLKYLKRLNVDGYKDLGSLEFVKELKSLEILLLNVGKIESIEVLKDLKQLKAVSFFGSTTIILDGDLEPLTELEQLSMLMIVDRKHYSHKLIKPWDWNNFGIPTQLLVPK